MNEHPSRCIKLFPCSEQDWTARLLCEISQEQGKVVLRSIHCDNPKLQDLNNYCCDWSCWEELNRQLNSPNNTDK